MSHSDIAATAALNEAMRKPLSAGFGLARIFFALGTFIAFHDAAAFGLWAVLWASSFAKDAFTGIAPFQTILGAAFRLVGWLLWFALFLG
jgi:hypothetical protein